MNKVATILRGTAGAGKSTFADYIKNNFTTICCADDYFRLPSGEYVFDKTKLGQAHQYCKDRFAWAMNEGRDIIVCNTSVRRSDRNYYAKAAKEQGYIVFSVVMENFQDTKSVHNVPDDKVKEMTETLKNNIDL